MKNAQHATKKSRTDMGNAFDIKESSLSKELAIAENQRKKATQNVENMRKRGVEPLKINLNKNARSLNEMYPKKEEK